MFVNRSPKSQSGTMQNRKRPIQSSAKQSSIPEGRQSGELFSTNEHTSTLGGKPTQSGYSKKKISHRPAEVWSCDPKFTHSGTDEKKAYISKPGSFAYY